jgi:16S rRNA G966 N2-methylase RsmD
MAKNSRQPSLNYGENDTTAPGPLECLGQTFPNDEARRAHFTDLLREKLKDPAFRKIEGFPIGEDEDILALSDPPYYTACPNPFLKEFIEQQSADSTINYSRTPFAADVSIARHDHYSLAHTYHTKVSPLAIVQYIQHFTKQGDIVLDCFCGSGMTGLSCAGSNLASDSKGKQNSLSANNPRRAILFDLSPAATHIAHGYASRFSESTFAEAIDVITRAKLKDQVLFSVAHRGSTSREKAWNRQYDYVSETENGTLDYLVWSEILICPSCQADVVFGDIAYDPFIKTVHDSIRCKDCDSVFEKRQATRKHENYFDQVTGKSKWRPALVPIFVAYKFRGKRYYRKPEPTDTGLDFKIDLMTIPNPKEIMKGERFFKDGLTDLYGITHIHDFFTSRNLQAFGRLLTLSHEASYDAQRLIQFLVTSVAIKSSKLMNYNADGVGRVMKGTLYESSLVQEANPFWLIDISLKDMHRLSLAICHNRKNIYISTQSAAGNTVPDNSVDYVWVDPPFGKNLMYAELNQLWEWWLRAFTKDSDEAVIDEKRKKNLPYYMEEMAKCFSQAYRMLKPGRWITIEFHNSKNAIWNAIQESIAKAGFVIADVRVLDKRLMTYKQSQQGLVKVDLIISAYKPSVFFTRRFQEEAGSEAVAWDFVRSHLAQLPVVSFRNDKLEIIAERQRHMLFDRMVAFHVQRSISVPLSSAEFYQGLVQRFPERETMFFLADQVSRYEVDRIKVLDIEQLEFFVSDEKSAILWVRFQLSQRPMTYQNLQPIYMKEAQRLWDKHEQRLELRNILEQNFVIDDNDIWRVPDLKKESDLEQLRHRALMKEFQQYLDSKGKLKIVRTEALRAGFKDSWQKKDYTTIVQMAKRLPDVVIQEDPALLMYFDNASLLKGE